MEEPLVCDGDFGTLELFSSGVRISLTWHEGLPDGAKKLNGFVEWLMGAPGGEEISLEI